MHKQPGDYTREIINWQSKFVQSFHIRYAIYILHLLTFQVPQAELLLYLQSLAPSSPLLGQDDSIGIGLDSCVLPTRHPGISLVETTDFFYPLVNDPYLMGKIACANVLSDLYAMGVKDVDNMLLLLGIAKDMSSDQRKVVVPMILEGFRDLAKEADVTVNGGQTVVNPWMIIGGVATSVCTKDEIIMPNNAVAGDKIVLTKPIGIQPAVNVHQWMTLETASWDIAKELISPDAVEKGYDDATTSMTTLNLLAAKLMHKHNAHAATDVTGFGILGHSRNLAEFQSADVDFIIHTLPVFAGFADFCRQLKAQGGRNFKLLEGNSSETSGGLLVCLSNVDAENFVEDMRKEGGTAWIVGDVVDGSNTSKIEENPSVIEVSY